MALRASAKSKSSGSSGGGLRSRAKGRMNMQASQGENPDNVGQPAPPPAMPSAGMSDVPKMPMPKHPYLTSFATIPALRKSQQGPF